MIGIGIIMLLLYFLTMKWHALFHCKLIFITYCSCKVHGNKHIINLVMKLPENLVNLVGWVIRCSVEGFGATNITSPNYEAVVSLILLQLKSFTRSEPSAAVSIDAIFNSQAKSVPWVMHWPYLVINTVHPAYTYLILYWTIYPPAYSSLDLYPAYSVMYSLSSWIISCLLIHDAISFVSYSCIHSLYSYLWDKVCLKAV